jgi:TonB family protein
MAYNFSAPDEPPKRRSLRSVAEERLPKWVLVSLVVHTALILFLIMVPFGSLSKREAPPSYVVDLVGGEKIGGRSLGTRIEPAPKPKPAPVEAPPAAPPEPAAKKDLKAEKPTKAEKVEKAKVKPAEEIPIAKAKPAAKPDERKKEAAPKPKQEDRQNELAQKTKPTREANDSAKSEEDSLDKVRERLMQAAIERARNRAASSAGASSSGVASSGTSSKSEPLSAGSGQGLGAQSLGSGGIGGEGILKSVDFIAYQNRLINTIKGNWAWAGRNSDLKVVVQFGIKENGEVVGLRVVQRSGDPTYDESVVRAIKQSSPFSAPPEAHRKEFADVEMTFRPRDFGA